MATIQIHKFRESIKDGEHFASARIAGEDVWFSCREVKLTATPEAFLSAFLVAAQHQGDRLSCESPVCPVWLENIRELLPITADWWGLKAEQPVVLTEEKARKRRWRKKTAVFFTCGVDSFHTLLFHRPEPDALINIQGYDIGLDNKNRQEDANRSLKHVAKSKGIPLIRIRTNLRQHSYFKKSGWNHTHGGAMAAVAHLLGESYQNFILSSSTRRSDPRAWGSSWQIDRFWSSAAIHFSTYGEHFSRAEKMEQIADDPLVREHLRVCWQSKEPQANCGRCAKCTSTMVSLTWAGKFDLLKHRFEEIPDLAGAVGKWNLDPIRSPAELDPVHMRPERLHGPLRKAIISRRTTLLGTIHAGDSNRSSFPRHQLIPDEYYKPLMKLSEGHVVYYHKVHGNVGDDLIHAATYQLFKRFGVTVTENPDEATQVVLCGGGSIGIWEGCALMREEIYRHCADRGIPAILYPQSVGGPGEIIPDLVQHRFAREWSSLPEMPGARLMPDMALAYRMERDHGPPLFGRGQFLRNDREGLFPDHPLTIGDPPHLVPRKLEDYFQLAAGYSHLVTDRLHFAVAGLLLKRRVTLLPNKYHKNRSMWQTWLKDMGCEWADTPEQVEYPTANRRSAFPANSQTLKLGMVMHVHHDGKPLETHLRYHRAVGVDVAYLFLDHRTDRTAEIEREFPWVRVIRREAPEDPGIFEAHRTACMNEALRMARDENLGWLLGVDAGEFAFGNYAVAEGEIDAPDLESIPPGLRESPQIRRWLRANLKCMLREVPDEIEQVILTTREALPLAQPPATPFWNQEYFIAYGEYPAEIPDPLTGEPRKSESWLGHRLGKAIIRTTANLQAFDSHSWTKWQATGAPDPAWRFPIPTLRRGWHAHYPHVDPVVWLEEYRNLARSQESGSSPTAIGFPKSAWARAAKNWSVDDATRYLQGCARISPESARQWCAEAKGVVHHPIFGMLLQELESSNPS